MSGVLVCEDRPTPISQSRNSLPSRIQKMNEFTQIQEIEVRNSKKFAPGRKALTRKKRGTEIYKSILARAPSRNSSEVPILVLLSLSPAGEMKTKDVLEQLKNGPWFEEL